MKVVPKDQVDELFNICRTAQNELKNAINGWQKTIEMIDELQSMIKELHSIIEKEIAIKKEHLTLIRQKDEEIAGLKAQISGKGEVCEGIAQ